MSTIQVCPSKKFNHKKTHRLLSERALEIISKCKKGQKMNLYRFKSVIHGRMPKYRRTAYHQHPSVNPYNPYSKCSNHYFKEGSRYRGSRFDYRREYTPIPKRFISQFIPEPANIKYFPEKEQYQAKEKHRDYTISLKMLHVEDAIMSILMFY